MGRTRPRRSRARRGRRGRPPQVGWPGRHGDVGEARPLYGCIRLLTGMVLLLCLRWRWASGLRPPLQRASSSPAGAPRGDAPGAPHHNLALEGVGFPTTLGALLLDLGRARLGCRRGALDLDGEARGAGVVGWLGFEPRTNGLKGRCSTAELPTLGKMVRDRGFEPLTPSVSRKCSTTELTALTRSSGAIQSQIHRPWQAWSWPAGGRSDPLPSQLSLAATGKTGILPRA